MWGKKLKRNTENDKKNPSVANLRKFQKIFSYESEGLTLDFKEIPLFAPSVDVG